MDTEDNVGRYKKISADHRQELERHYHVSSLGLFGSRLRGDYREDSDLVMRDTLKSGIGSRILNEAVSV